MSETQHAPVLLENVLSLLALTGSEVVVDATLGGGGYTRALLARLSQGRVLAFDWDAAALERFRHSADSYEDLAAALESKRLILVQQNFGAMREVLTALGLSSVDAVVVDLGLSSDQLADPERGLSFQSDGPLDMRMNSSERVTAADLVNSWSADQLATLFATYADEPESRRIAEAIVRDRGRFPIIRTGQLAQLVSAHVARARRTGRIHPATRVFQALRIAVNGERAALLDLLAALPHVLAPLGKAAIVSFHSGEDALVKQAFRTLVRNHPPIFRSLTPRPLRASAEERRKNPRARSALLRSIQKI